MCCLRIVSIILGMVPRSSALSRRTEVSECEASADSGGGEPLDRRSGPPSHVLPAAVRTVSVSAATSRSWTTGDPLPRDDRQRCRLPSAGMSISTTPSRSPAARSHVWFTHRRSTTRSFLRPGSAHRRLDDQWRPYGSRHRSAQLGPPLRGPSSHGNATAGDVDRKVVVHPDGPRRSHVALRPP